MKWIDIILDSKDLENFEIKQDSGKMLISIKVRKELIIVDIDKVHEMNEK